MRWFRSYRHGVANVSFPKATEVVSRTELIRSIHRRTYLPYLTDHHQGTFQLNRRALIVFSAEDPLLRPQTDIFHFLFSSVDNLQRIQWFGFLWIAVLQRHISATIVYQDTTPSSSWNHSETRFNVFKQLCAAIVSSLPSLLRESILFFGVRKLIFTVLQVNWKCKENRSINFMSNQQMSLELFNAEARKLNW